MLDFLIYIVYNDFVHLMVKLLVCGKASAKPFIIFSAFLLLFIADDLKAGTFAPQSLFQ